eukprot:5412523-Prymnesium_polylepis.2
MRVRAWSVFTCRAVRTRGREDVHCGMHCGTWQQPACGALLAFVRHAFRACLERYSRSDRCLTWSREGSEMARGLASAAAHTGHGPV